VEVRKGEDSDWKSMSQSSLTAFFILHALPSFQSSEH